MHSFWELPVAAEAAACGFGRNFFSQRYSTWKWEWPCHGILMDLWFCFLSIFVVNQFSTLLAWIRHSLMIPSRCIRSVLKSTQWSVSANQKRRMAADELLLGIWDKQMWCFHIVNSMLCLFDEPLYVLLAGWMEGQVSRRMNAVWRGQKMILLRLLKTPKGWMCCVIPVARLTIRQCVL